MILLLDIDGVLSPLGAPRTDDFHTIESAYGNWWTTEHHLSFLYSAIQSPAQFIWATAWEDMANLWCEYLNVPDQAYLDFSHTTNTDTSWLKLEVVQNFLETSEHEHVVWIDDDFSAAALQWGAERGIHMVQPDADVGLTTVQADEVLRMLYR